MIPIAAATLLTIAAAAPVDRLIDAAGRKLHIQCDGERRPGAPIVVLEAGAGQSAMTWSAVFAPIAQFARVCAYDRLDLGSSDKSSAVPSFAGTVETLHALLRAAAEPPPYVMAGHSYGGALVRFYATRYPSEITGLVLIDSTHEDQERRLAGIISSNAPSGPDRVNGEIIDPEGMAEEMSRSPWHANIPLVVLTSTATDRTDPRIQLLARELNQDLASRSPQSELIVARNSGHFIQLDEPSLVIDAVRRVVAKATK